MSAAPDDALFAPGATTAIGSLPHRDAIAAAVCALESTTIPCVPSLPRRSPAESMVAQAVSALSGVTPGQYGSLAIDARRFDTDAPACVDLRSEAFGGLRAFLDVAHARHHHGPVKWQFVGPITLGVSLIRAGAPKDVAFRLAVNTVRAHLVAIAAEVARRLPGSAQVVLLDEPSFGSLMSPEFPIAPDTAVDAMSEAMAVLEPLATVGLHCCDLADVPSMLASGPRVLSMPLFASLADSAGYLHDFLVRGGTIAWGAVATGGPVPPSADRYWRSLVETWQGLVDRGCDRDLLRHRAVITPQCGLGTHSLAVAQRVLELTSVLGDRVLDEATAVPFPR